MTFWIYLKYEAMFAQSVPEDWANLSRLI